MPVRQDAVLHFSPRPRIIAGGLHGVVERLGHFFVRRAVEQTTLHVAGRVIADCRMELPPLVHEYMFVVWRWRVWKSSDYHYVESIQRSEGRLPQGEKPLGS